MQDWDRMIALGLAASAGLESSQDVVALHAWVQTASADLKLAEALMGSPLGPDDPIDAHLPSTFVFDAASQAFIARYVYTQCVCCNVVLQLCEDGVRESVLGAVVRPTNRSLQTHLVAITRSCPVTAQQKYQQWLQASALLTHWQWATCG